MPDYSKGKIYKIISSNSDEIYIGSTTQPLYDRMSGHRVDFRRGRTGGSADFFTKYGMETCKIILIENFSCSNKDELTAREQYFIDTLKCCNKQNANSGVPSGTRAEDPVKYSKMYREKNIEKIKERDKVKMTCECGCEFRKHGLARHIKSKKHQDFITKDI